MIPQEIKEKIFALYWNHEDILSYEYGDIMPDVWKDNFPKYVHSMILVLTPLSQITDEDAIAVGRIENDYPKSSYTDNLDYCKNLIVRACRRYSLLDFESIDYLRSKGYALPAFGYSVQKLVEEGIFKLKS